MKPQSPFTHAMDGLRPRPARRAVMLQRVLATRQPPLSLNQWRCALAGVPAVMVLALGLAWSLGAYDINRAPAPDKVTQAAAVATAAEVQATNPGNGKVQRLTNVAWAMDSSEDHSSTLFELESIHSAELAPEVIQTVTGNLETKGWFSVRFTKIRDGYYQLSASKNAVAGETASETLISDSKLMECLSNQRLQMRPEPLGYMGLNLRPSDDGDSEMMVRDIEDENHKSYEAISKFSVRKAIPLSTVMDRVPLKQALNNAFYFQGDKPLLKTAEVTIQSGDESVVTPIVLTVTQVNLLSLDGVPFYQIPLQAEQGSSNAYALAVAENDLQTVPELYRNYQDIMSGKSMVMETLYDSFLWCGAPAREAFGKEIPLDFSTLTLMDGVGENLPQAGALLYTNSGTLSDAGLQRMVESLQQKGWETISPDGLSEDGLLLRSTSDGKAVKDAQQHRKLANQYIADSGLVRLFDECGYVLSLTPSLVAQGETQYDLRPKTGLTIQPGFVRLRLGSDRSVIECRIQMLHTELLQLVTLRPLSACLAEVFVFSIGDLNEADMPAIQKGMDITDARLIYVRGIPFYKMTILLPGTKKSFTAYALAITMDELKAFPQALEDYKGFLQDCDETKESKQLVNVVDANTGELLVSVDLPK